ncbi:TVP38/TMEM64 family inner membrane protein ydjZ [Corynebacterium pseudotuberculosis]|nr:TVP38/TMEM64 family inner membrane protein ydjZ [Corynebacterium pseudotuberculosis]
MAKKISVFALGILFILTTILVDIPSIETLRSWADNAGSAFVILFAFLYIGITQFPIPRTLLTLSAGVLFGSIKGIVIALTCTTISAVISLLIIRTLLGEWMEPRLTHPAVSGINSRLRHRGWLAVASLRMIAGVPFSIMNYVAALTSVPPLGFALATLIGSAPGTIVVVILGDSILHGTDVKILLFSASLAFLGILGLLIDARMPVKTPR